MSQADDALSAYNALSEPDKKAVADTIAASRALPNPTGRLVAVLWTMVVGTFCVAFLVGGFLMYRLVQHGTSTAVIGPIVTGSLGVLAGLLAPSPVSNASSGK